MEFPIRTMDILNKRFFINKFKHKLCINESKLYIINIYEDKFSIFATCLSYTERNKAGSYQKMAVFWGFWAVFFSQYSKHVASNENLDSSDL